MKAIVENSSKYNEFVRINVSAIKSYEDFGFVEFKRVPVVKFFKRSKIFRNT